MLSTHLTYPRRMHGSVFKNGWGMCRVCSGSCVCTHPWRCTDAELYWLSTQAQRRSHRFLNQSSPPPYEILYREESLLGGWAWVDARPLVFPVVIISRVICYYSCLVCLQTLLCGCHGQFLATICSLPSLKATSPRLHQIGDLRGGGKTQKIMLEYIGPSQEKNPPP